jgi:hypothetical protein
MSNYKINIDKPLPDPQRIRSHQDFDSLYKQYQVTARFSFWQKLYRNPRYFAAVVAVVAVVVLVFRSVTQEGIAEIAYVNPPVATYNVPFETVNLPAEQSLTFETSQSTRLQVPAHAFVTPEGQAVAGEIELRYREFHQLEDYFLAGIPLAYDSATPQQLITLGGIEVAAFQNDQLLRLKKEARIEVQFRSRESRTGYNLYFLDTTARNWAWVGKDSVKPVPVALPPRPERPRLLAEADALTPRNVAAPFKPGKPFGVRIKNRNEFPEFAGYERLYWEYLEGPGSDNPWTTGLISASGEQTWEDVRVQRLSGDRYRLTFARQAANGNLEFRRVVGRVLFAAKSLTEANQYYQDQLQRYDAELAQWQEAREDARQQEQERRHLERQYQEALQAWETKMAQLNDTLVNQEQGYFRVFQLHQLGIHNLAYAVERPGARKSVFLFDENNNLMAGRLIDQGKQPVVLQKGLRTLFATQWAEDSLHVPLVEGEWILLTGLSEEGFGYISHEVLEAGAGVSQGEIQAMAVQGLKETFVLLEKDQDLIK